MQLICAFDFAYAKIRFSLLCFEKFKVLSSQWDTKEFVLLRRAISLKVNFEKVKFSNCVCNLVIMNGHSCKLFETVQNKGNGEINTA